jgi:hypothetical protein
MLDPHFGIRIHTSKVGGTQGYAPLRASLPVFFSIDHTSSVPRTTQADCTAMGDD